MFTENYLATVFKENYLASMFKENYLASMFKDTYLASMFKDTYLVSLKRKRNPPTEARNAHRPNLDGDILLFDITNKTYTHIMLQSKITLLKRIQFTKLNHATLDNNTPSAAIRVRSSVITVISVRYILGRGVEYTIICICRSV